MPRPWTISNRRPAATGLVALWLAALWVGVAAPGVACAGGEHVERSRAEEEARAEDAPVQDAAGGGEATAGGEEMTMASDAKAERPLATDHPVTVRIELSPELATAIRAAGAGAGSERFLRLSIQGLENPGIGVDVRAFLNLPQADRDTPLDSPHYLGQSTFFPLGPEGRGREDSFLFDAGATLARLPPEERLAGDRTLAVTLVLVPPPGPAPEGGETIEVPFEGVRIEAVEPE